MHGRDYNPHRSLSDNIKNKGKPHSTAVLSPEEEPKEGGAKDKHGSNRHLLMEHRHFGHTHQRTHRI